MDNRIKYGAYWIGIAITIGGVLWFDRPNDMRVLGEDVAALYEAEAERSIIPFLVGTQTPNFPSYNGGSNTVDSLILYKDIDNIACRIRNNYQQSGSILWTMTPITNGHSIASMAGTYTLTNTTYSPLFMSPVTNATYTYSTNKSKDEIVVSSTRLKGPASLFEYRDNVGGSILTPTNLPVSYPLWSREAAQVTSYGLINGSAWPLERTYTFPWEQWNDLNRWRVMVRNIASSSVASWTNVAWASITNLNFSFKAQTTNTPSYCFSAFVDANGNQSLTFGFIQPPTTTGNGLSMSSYIIQGATNAYIPFSVSKQGAAYGSILKVEVAAGNALTILKSDDFGSTTFVISPSPTVGGSVLRFTSYNDVYPQLYLSPRTNVPPIYAYVYLGPAWQGTNAYFKVDAPAFDTPTVTGSVTSNSITSGQIVRNDVRIDTNKLYRLRQVLTNLTATIYVGASVDSTQTIQSVSTSADDYNWTVYADPAAAEWRDNGSGYTPSYKSYDISSIIAANDTRPYTVTTTNQLSTLSLCEYDSMLTETKSADVFISYGSPAWESMIDIGGKSRVSLNHAKGCTVDYPSDWAITNGYVKKVRVFALVKAKTRYEATGHIIYPTISSSDYADHYDIGGSFWYGGNLGVTAAGLNLNVPATIDTTITKSRLVEFESYGYDGFMDTAKLSLIYEVDNPTTSIIFDVPEYSFTQAYPSRYTHIFEATSGADALRSEETRNDYYLSYSVEILRWVVYVEWDFKHLGGDFTPANNTPAWRQ